jgi:hypothetical protein
MAKQDNYKYLNGTTSQTIVTGNGAVYGVLVNSHTSGTLKFWDNTAASGTVIMNTFTFPAGSGIYMFPGGISFYTGLFATVGGTLDYTILYDTN